MAKKPPVRIALDLETTGLHVEQDAILEVAAVKFQGNEIIDTFETFVAPERTIPYRIQRLTGIKLEYLVGAPRFESIAGDIQRFLGDLPIVGHSIPFDVGFLRRRGLARTNPLIDTFELAVVLLPSLASYNLGQVAESLGVQVPQDRHRAMVDAVLAMDVFLALYEKLRQVDLALLKDLANLDAPRSWPLLHFFKHELRERQEQDGLRGSLARGSLGDRFYAQLGMDPRVLSFAIARQKQAHQAILPGSTPQAAQTPEQALSTLERLQEQDGVEVIPELTEPPEPPAQTLPKGYRYQTARTAVRKALEQKTPLLIEVTVGGNDYTPVLLPALEWLSSPGIQAHPRRLVIACSSQQNARRLIEIILPRLQAMLKSQLPVAYLAEHGGYLCTHRWFGAALRRTSGELTAEQARGLAKLGLWAHQTMTGERSELTLLPQELAAWERISSDFERALSIGKQSLYEQCTYRSNGYCFVSLAQERVNAASIVVTTHAGLFDDLSRPHSLLASIDHRLLLDTDLLEEENARWSALELDQVHLIRLINTIGTELQGNRYQGLLALAAPALRENGPGGLSATPTVAKSELDMRMLGWFQSLRQASAAVEKLFLCLHRLLEEFIQQGFNGNGGGRDRGRSDALHRAYSGTGRSNERADQPLRLMGQVRSLGAWAETERAWQQTTQRLQGVIELAHEAERMILTTKRSRHRLDSGRGEDTILAAELAAVAQQLQEQKRLGQQALSLAESDSVYWLRMPPVSPAMQQASQPRNTGGGISPSSPSSPVASPENVPILYGQLVQTSALLKRLKLLENASTIFVGTALSVDNAFSFYRARFGLENDACPALSIVTEHHEQTLFYLPDDVPEPNSPQYQRHLDETLIQLATTLGGQLIALFTSHAALRSSYAAIKPVLEARGILVLAQGMDGSPRQLWQVFQSQKGIVVLGTGGFWDGFDDIQRSPACLFVTRLPMPVLNDPPLAARAEHYSDQLHQFTAPLAALRLKRTLNRAMWSDSRRNAVVLFDRRVTSKEYGSVVLHSLPRCSQRQAAASHMAETITNWLNDTGAWD